MHNDKKTACLNFPQNKLDFRKETIFNLVLGTTAVNCILNCKKFTPAIAGYCMLLFVNFHLYFAVHFFKCSTVFFHYSSP